MVVIFLRFVIHILKVAAPVRPKAHRAWFFSRLKVIFQ